MYIKSKSYMKKTGTLRRKKNELRLNIPLYMLNYEKFSFEIYWYVFIAYTIIERMEHRKCIETYTNFPVKRIIKARNSIYYKLSKQRSSNYLNINGVSELNSNSHEKQNETEIMNK